MYYLLPHNPDKHLFNLSQLSLHDVHLILNFSKALLEITFNWFNDIVLKILEIIFLSLVGLFVRDCNHDLNVFGFCDHVLNAEIFNVKLVSVLVGVHLSISHHSLIGVTDYRNQEVKQDDQDEKLVQEPDYPDGPELESLEKPV